MRRFSFWACGLAALIALPAGAMAFSSYDVTAIAALSGDDFSTAYAINASGQIIGTSDEVNLSAFIPGSGSASGAVSAATGLFISGSTNSIIPALGANARGISFSTPVALNDSGEVVGESTDTTGNQAIIYSGGVLTNLGAIVGGAVNNASSVNATGEIIGSFRQLADSGPAAQSYLYNGTVNVINPGGNFTGAFLINNSGVIVGGVTLVGGAHAATLTGTTVHDLGTLPGVTESAGLAVNSAGDVAGWSGNVAPSGPTPITKINLTQDNALGVVLGISPGGLSIGEGSEFETGDAFFYNASTQKMTDLGTLGGGFSAALGINDAGDIVGTSLTAAGDYHAFLDDGSSTVDLNTLLPAQSSWTLIDANGINSAGDIVGFGDLDGAFEGFELTPSGTITGTGGNGNGNGSGTGGGTGTGTGGAGTSSVVPLPPALASGLLLLAGLGFVSILKSRRPIS
jgi:probable HAF family extracellular repeat protein